MKVFIFAAGLGTRLLPLTKNTPKPMLKIQNKPVLEHILKLFIEQGFNNFAISLHYKYKQVVDYFGDGTKWGIKIQYSISVDKLLERAEALRNFSDKLKRSFVVANGDTIFNFDLKDAIKFHKNKNAVCTLILIKSNNPNNFDTWSLDNEMKINNIFLKEERNKNRGTLISSGVYIFSPLIFDFIPKDIPIDLEREIFKKMAGQNAEIFGYISQGNFIDIGTPKKFYSIEKGNIHSFL